MKSFRVLLLSLFVWVVGGSVTLAAMTSTNYEIRFDTIGSGGDNVSSSTSYHLRDTIGGTGPGALNGDSYDLQAGFREGIYDPTVNFALFIQDRSSQVAATGLSGTSVNVTTTTGISVGDLIALVQDEGAAQVTAIGEVVQVNANAFRVDAWTMPIGVTPAINGHNDYVYVLDSASLSLGSITRSNVSTGIVAWEVNTDTDDGYTVYAIENRDLISENGRIEDVSDGSVTAGSSEYGAISSDPTIASSNFDTQDSPFRDAFRAVATRTKPEELMKARDFLTLKASVSSEQRSGIYSHTLRLIYVGDY